MNNDRIPASAFAKMLSLSDASEYYSSRVIQTEQGIAAARQRLTGGMPQRDFDDLRASLDALIADLPVLKKKLHTAQSTYSACKSFLDDLPPGATLEPVKIDVDGHTLEEVRTKLEAAQAELAQLRSLPVSSADIEQRLRAYVEGMARPRLTGIGPGERLKVVWPGSGWGSSGDREDRADPLALTALIHGDKMVAHLLAEVDRMTSVVVPIKERASRIAELTTEVEQLAYTEEALIERASEAIDRSVSAPPQAILGVRIVKAASRAS
jgi:hypothetical protein